MADFSTAADLEIRIDDRSLRNAKQTIESELGQTAVGVTDGGTASAQLGRGGMSGRQRRRARRSFRMERQRTDDIETAVALLDDIEEKVGGGGGGGSGPLGGFLGSAGTGLGLGLGSAGAGIGAGAAGLGIGAGLGLASGDLPRGIGEGLGSTLEGTGDFAEGVGDGIGGTLEGTGDFAEGVGEGIGGTLEGTGDFAEGVGSGLGDAVGGFGEGAGDILSGINPFKDQNTNISTLESQSTPIQSADFGDVSTLNLSVDQSNVANAGSGGGSLIDVSSGVSNNAEASGSVAVEFGKLIRQVEKKGREREPLPVDDPSPLSVDDPSPLEVEDVDAIEVDAPDSISLLRPTETESRREPDIEEAMEKERPPEGAFEDSGTSSSVTDTPQTAAEGFFNNPIGTSIDALNQATPAPLDDTALTTASGATIGGSVFGPPGAVVGGVGGFALEQGQALATGAGGSGRRPSSGGSSGGSFFGDAQLNRTTINNDITADSDFNVDVEVATDSIRSDLDELQRQIERRIDDVEQSLQDEIDRVERDIRR